MRTLRTLDRSSCPSSWRSGACSPPRSPRPAGRPTTRGPGHGRSPWPRPPRPPRSRSSPHRPCRRRSPIRATRARTGCVDCHSKVDKKQAAIADDWRASVHGQGGRRLRRLPRRRSDVRRDHGRDGRGSRVPRRPRSRRDRRLCAAAATPTRTGCGPYQVCRPTSTRSTARACTASGSLDGDDTRVAICIDCHGVARRQEGLGPDGGRSTRSTSRRCAPRAMPTRTMMAPYGIPTDQYDGLQAERPRQAPPRAVGPAGPDVRLVPRLARRRSPRAATGRGGLRQVPHGDPGPLRAEPPPRPGRRAEVLDLPRDPRCRDHRRAASSSTRRPRRSSARSATTRSRTAAFTSGRTSSRTTPTGAATPATTRPRTSTPRSTAISGALLKASARLRHRGREARRGRRPRDDRDRRRRRRSPRPGPTSSRPEPRCTRRS